MIGIKDKAAKEKELRRQYALYEEQGGSKKFSEFVEWKSKTDRDFFRWLTGNRQIADYGMSLSESTRTILISALGY